MTILKKIEKTVFQIYYTYIPLFLDDLIDSFKSLLYFLKGGLIFILATLESFDKK